MKVFSNLAISADGKIADARTPGKPLGTPLDRRTMQVLRRRSDVIVVGAQTLRVQGRPMRTQGARRQPANAVVTASGDLDPKWSFWEADDIVRWVFTTQEGLARAQAAAKDRAFVVAVGRKSVSVDKVLERLKASAYKNVLVEGGGVLVASFLAAQRLQEMHLTLTPWLLGGLQNPSLVGGAGLPEWQRLSLLKVKRIKDEVYLHFKVKGARRV